MTSAAQCCLYRISTVRNLQTVSIVKRCDAVDTACLLQSAQLGARRDVSLILADCRIIYVIVCVRVMKAYRGSGGISPLIFNLDAT